MARESVSLLGVVNIYRCWGYNQLGASMRPCKKASYDWFSRLDWSEGDKLVGLELSGPPGGTIIGLLEGW